MTSTAGHLGREFTIAYGFISSVPRDGAGVPVGDPPSLPRPAHPAAGDLAIRFNGEIDAGSVTTADVELRDAGGNAVPFSLSIGSGLQNDRILVDPDADLTPGITYTLTIPAGAEVGWAGVCPPAASPACQVAMFDTPKTISFRVE